jgi:hypothetical protein
VIGTLCDSAVSGKPRSTHAHYGRRAPAKKPPAARRFDVRGPRGGIVARNVPSSTVAQWAVRWLARYDRLTIGRATPPLTVPAELELPAFGEHECGAEPLELDPERDELEDELAKEDSR